MHSLSLHRTQKITTQIRDLKGDYGFVLTIEVRDDINKKFEINIFGDNREILEELYVA